MMKFMKVKYLFIITKNVTAKLSILRKIYYFRSTSTVTNNGNIYISLLSKRDINTQILLKN